MKAITISIFLTLVGFSLTVFGADAPAAQPSLVVQPTCTSAVPEQPASMADCDGTPQVDCKGTQWVWSCNAGTTKAAKRDKCTSLYDTYGSKADSVRDKSTTTQQKAQDDAFSVQDKITKLQNQLTEDTQKTKDEIQSMQEKYQSDNLKRQQDSQSAQMSIADKIREQTQQISEMNGKLQVAQVQLISVQNSYTATVNANNVSMVRMKCMSIIRKWMKDNSVGATIKGSIGNTGNQQLLLDSQWNSCIATEQANSQATISNAQAAVTQAQANISSLQTALQSANSALAQMNAAATQQNQMAQQNSQIAATAYQQKMQNAQTKLTTAQTQAQQQIMQLNMQAMSKAQLGMTPQSTGQLDSALKNYKAVCCTGETPNWTSNTDGLSVDDESNACSADTSTTSLANQNQQQIMNMAPALMQTMGAH